MNESNLAIGPGGGSVEGDASAHRSSVARCHGKTSYFILGLAFGFLSPSLSWKWSIWLTLPALVIAILYSFNESGRWLLHLSYPLLAFAATAAAAYAGSRLRMRVG